MLPLISVIVPVRNERATLPRVLDELMKQNYPPDRYEILVVDGQSIDGTAQLVQRRYARSRVPVRVIRSPGTSSAAGRNAGVRAAAGDVILFLDGRCFLPSRNLLEDTAAILDRTGAACLCRPQPLLAPSPTHTGEVIAQARTSWLVRGRHSHRHDLRQAGFVDPVCSGAAYLRRVFYRVGLFDESFDAHEDLEFNLRVQKAGFRAYSDPRLAVYGQPQSTLRGLLHHMIRSGRGRVQLMRRHRECFSAARLAPLAVLASFLLAGAAWLLLPAPLAAVATLPAAAFVAALIVATVQIFLRYGLASAFKAPLVFATLYTGLGLGLAREFLSPARPAEAATAADLLYAGQQLQPAEEVERAA